MVARVIPVDPFDLVVFGGTGDLAQRKLLPALYRRMLGGQALQGSRIIAAARRDLDADGFRHMAEASLRDHAGPGKLDPDQSAVFLAMLDYVRIDAEGEGGWASLCDRLEGSERMRAFYLSVAPQLFGAISERLAASGCRTPDTRLVVEKPLGRDLESAQALNRQLATLFEERQIYRIDHYLGKETVQNLMALRFANALFEPIWNARHVDHVQITVAERVGVGGRGAYYDRNGAIRDMMQNHLLQLLCLIAMEPPAHFEPDAVRDEKLKVLRSLKPLDGLGDVVRGQYRGINCEAGYCEDAENPGSRTESFVAIKAEIANWRWNGAPVLSAHRKAAAGADVRDRRRLQGRATFDLPRERGWHASERAGDQAAARRGDHAETDYQGAGPRRDAAVRGAARHDLCRDHGCRGPEHAGRL